MKTILSKIIEWYKKWDLILGQIFRKPDGSIDWETTGLYFTTMFVLGLVIRLTIGKNF